jgi:hypothetical protein
VVMISAAVLIADLAGHRLTVPASLEVAAA